MENKNNNKYYVYVYLDPRFDGGVYGDYNFQHKPFYVGKGKEKRYLEHWKIIKNNRKAKECEKNNILKELLNENLEPKIIKIKTDVSENEALLTESKVIKDIGLSNLTNMIKGGFHYQEGYNHTKKTIKKYRKNQNVK